MHIIIIVVHVMTYNNESLVITLIYQISLDLRLIFWTFCASFLTVFCLKYACEITLCERILEIQTSMKNLVLDLHDFKYTWFLILDLLRAKNL